MFIGHFALGFAGVHFAFQRRARVLEAWGERAAYVNLGTDGADGLLKAKLKR
jgi:hypothetical protein